MLSELVDLVIGVDSDRDWITIAALEALSAGVVATERFPATDDGYNAAIFWADVHALTTERAWSIESSGSYGRCLARAFASYW